MSEVLDTTLLASELRVVLGQLLRRLRADYRFSLSHMAVLGRLDREQTSTTSDLAAAQRVRPQSMTQTVSDLEAAGLVAKRADPDDGRRVLLELTDEGRAVLAADRRKTDGWLATAIASDLTDRERGVLADSVLLLRRLVGD